MRRTVLAVGTAALLVLPLAACSSGSAAESSGSPSESASSWEDEYRQAITDDFANASDEDLGGSCESIATNQIADPQAYVDFLLGQNPDLTLEEWVTSLDELEGTESNLAEIVPDDAQVADVLAISGEAHIAECNSRA